MKTFERYIRCVRPGIEAEGYFNKPKTIREFLTDLFYFDFDVEVGLFYASLHVAVFGFGFKVAIEDPLVVSIRLDAPCCDVRLDAGLRHDWERADLFREADEKRDEFKKYLDTLGVGATIDRAWFESEHERKARIRKVRRDFSRKFWTASPDGDIDIGNSVFIVFKEDGVYAEVRPENPVPFDIGIRNALSFDRPVNIVSADIEDLDGNTMLKAVVGEVHAGELDAEGRVITVHSPGAVSCCHAENGDPEPCAGCREDDFNQAAAVERKCGIVRHQEIGCDTSCSGRV